MDSMINPYPEVNDGYQSCNVAKPELGAEGSQEASFFQGEFNSLCGHKVNEVPLTMEDLVQLPAEVSEGEPTTYYNLDTSNIVPIVEEESLELPPINTETTAQDEAISNGYELRYSCGICSHQSSDLATMRTHYFTHQQLKKIFSCELCNFQTDTESNLQIHIGTHVKARVEPSPKKSPNRSVRRTVGLKSHACNQCPYEAKTESQLKLHLKVHSGDKEFSCTLCEFETHYKANLNKHYIRLHSA